MEMNPSRDELNSRISKFFDTLKTVNYDTVLIVNKINQYYFTGTIQDGILVFRKDGTVKFFVRRSYERARLECPLDIIEPMKTYKDMLSVLPADLGITYLETQTITLAIKERLSKYFSMESVLSIDNYILSLRAVKSDYELEIIKESGRQHNYLLNSIVPSILKEGMSETDFFGQLYNEMIKLGYQGLSMFSMFQMEMIIGQMGLETTRFILLILMDPVE